MTTTTEWDAKFAPGPGLALDTRLSPERSLRDDRAAELAEFLSLDVQSVHALYDAYHVSSTKRPPAMDATDVGTILSNYTDRSTLEWLMTRLMLHYSRLGMAARLVSYFRGIYGPGERPKMVDYGCGVADFGLLFALNGFDVTLVDVDRGLLDFAAWRFRRRGLSVQALPVTADVEYPAVENADIVVAGDVLEHLNNPVEGVEAVFRWLKPGGFFWFPDFPYAPKKVGWHHLLSASKLRRATATVVDERSLPVPGIVHVRQKHPQKDERPPAASPE